MNTSLSPPPAPESERIAEGSPASKSLGVWDAVSISIGIVVGTAIFKAPTVVFQNVSGPWQAQGLWLLGGLLSLIGAMCYAELATTYPQSGGDYQYLRRAFGPCVGFLFGWAQLSVILTGSIGAMAYAFAEYMGRAAGLHSMAITWMAVAAVVVLSGANILGIVFGKATQNVLTILKIVGLAIIVLLGLATDHAGGLAGNEEISLAHSTSIGLALVFVLYAYGGWNDIAFVAAEVRDPKRNIPKSLLFSTCGVTAIYLIVNGAYLAVLGFEGAKATSTPATDLVRMALGENASRLISVLVAICTLGAINGLILTGSRLLSSVGYHHRAFRELSEWHAVWNTPTRAILAQGAIAILMILAVGTRFGQMTCDTSLALLGLGALPWHSFSGGFETLVSGTAPVFWFFFMLTGISQIVLRLREPERPRPFRTPLYPLLPIIFATTSAYMLVSSVNYSKSLTLIGLVPLGLGFPIYCLSEFNLLQMIGAVCRGSRHGQRAS